MNFTKDFHIGDILSITTGVLVSPRHMTGVYDIMDFMTGESLMTHQLPRAADEMRPRLLAQHSQLVDINASSVNPSNHVRWLENIISCFGETLPVQSERQFHEQRDPLEEAKRHFGEDQIIPVRLT